MTDVNTQVAAAMSIKLPENLPDLPKINRQKWRKGKEVVSRFFDELDYNNQIQSSYELTLLDRQNKNDRHDAA